MNPSQFIFKKDKKDKHIRTQLTLILKRSTHVKKETREMQKNEDNLWSYRRNLFQRIWHFTDDFVKLCKDNVNEAQFGPLEINNNRNKMMKEQGLYAQVVKLRQKDLKFISANKNKI